MIFVIAAVLTLIVSFVVALTSLIREQNRQMGSSAKSQPEPKVGNVPVSQTAQSFTVHTLNTQSPQSAQVVREPMVKPAGELPSEQIVDKDTNLSREPFFWEKKQQGQDQVIETASIEKVQQRLAEYTRSKQQKDIVKDEKTFPKKEIVKKNLSGEFSLSDLK